MIHQMIEERNPQIISCLADQGYQVDRYKGVVELLTTQRDRFPPISQSWRMIVTRTALVKGGLPTTPAVPVEQAQRR
jgi:hypothetical protein